MQETHKPDQPAMDYADLLSEVMASLIKAKRNNKNINVADVLSALDHGEDNSQILDWLVGNKVIGKRELQALLTRARSDARVISALGFSPQTCQEYVDCYARARGLSMRLDDVLSRPQHDANPAFAVYPVKNVDQLRRALRQTRDDFKLSFSNESIADAVETWCDRNKEQSKKALLAGVGFSGDGAAQEWAALEAACFDLRETQPGFATAVLKKFMWQTLRKMSEVPVTRHLMPVITGPQDMGKSTFVEKLLSPMPGAVKPTDFDMITDPRNIDIWATPVLFIDEMSHFTKSCMNTIKNVITASALTRRPMRSNGNVVVDQSATFIGCANGSLAQLARDNTGMRRFAELKWRHDPDWSVVNSTDWRRLWQSVDAFGEDPILPVLGALKRQQEHNRAQTPDEEWAMAFGPRFADWHASSKLFAEFSEWEQVNYPTSKTNLRNFGLTMTELALKPTCPWEKRDDRTGAKYRYNPEKAN